MKCKKLEGTNKNSHFFHFIILFISLESILKEKKTKREVREEF